MYVKKTIILSILLSLIVSCGRRQEVTEDLIIADYLHEMNIALEAAIVHDFFTPPVASRMYLYPNIAAYELLASNKNEYLSLQTIHADLGKIPENLEHANHLLSALFAFYYTSKALVYDSSALDIYVDSLKEELKEKGLTDVELSKADGYAKEVSEYIIQWSKSDNYPQMRSYPKYQLTKLPGSWVPTLPDYIDAMEPHWKKLRSITLDSSAQFKPKPPTEFDMSKDSPFYREAKEVYNTVNTNTKEQETIAKFWDCNPLVRQHQGHTTFAEKKLTPGGHWINIARIAMKEQKIDLMESAHIYVLVCTGIFDAFISCWDEKYRSNYIRPVTVIRQYLDPKWKPILYTPNFPEHPSGHSVVSTSAATILTAIFGEEYAFTDTTEVPYGMPERTFVSFFSASEEAAISRLYGGIHFRPAIENGKIQGNQIGKHVLKTLQLKVR